MKKPHTLGERIAQARRELGVRERRDISAMDVARAVGVSGAAVSQWESDTKSPREEALAKLADYLGVTPAYLRYGITEDTFGLQPNPTRTLREELEILEKPAAKKVAGGGPLGKRK